jgi:hypothetical protein
MVASLQVDMTRLVLEMRMVDKKFAASLRREIRAACLELGDDVLRKMKSATGWSTGKKHGTSIPDATTLRPNFSLRSAGVRIVTNRSKAPHAGPFDLGNHGDGKEGEGTFTNGHHGAIQKRPFFYKSAREIEPQAEARILAAMDIICREAGFR